MNFRGTVEILAFPKKLNRDFLKPYDTCHSETHFQKNHLQVPLKNLSFYKCNDQNNLLKFIIEQAQKNKINFQRLAASRSTGTDTDAFAYSNSGVASALISLPLRYMHTTVEMCSKDDVNSVIELIYQSLINLKNGQTFNYLK